MRRQHVAAVCLAVLVVTAGCASMMDAVRDGSVPTDMPGAAESTPTPATTPVVTETATGERATTRTSAPETAATLRSVETTAGGVVTDASESTAVPRESPWGTDPIVVGITANGDRDYAPLVREAAAYWEANDERYVGYQVRFDVRPDAADPDVLVNVSHPVPECGGATEPAGCAPLITDRGQRQSTQPVWILAGLSDESTVFVVKHEFGHLLGLGHDDRPRDVMRATSVLYTAPRTDASERAFAWDDPHFTVYADFPTAHRPREAAQQVNHALTYYADGAPGMPQNLTFQYVDDPEAADVVIEFADDDGCGGSAVASCARTQGSDPDGDGTVEMYTHLTITLAGVPTNAVGWHVGYWLAHATGAADDAEKPPPFRNATARDRRREWWK